MLLFSETYYLSGFSSSIFVIFRLCCQKTILTITKAMPIGRKIGVLPVTILTMPTTIKMRPLIVKSVAAVLYDFKFLDGLLTIADYSILNYKVNKYVGQSRKLSH